MIIIDHLEANITNNKIAGFDLDWTLIKPKEDRLFNKDEHDWDLLYKSCLNTLSKYNENGYTIIIVTYNTKSFKVKLINNFLKDCNFPIYVIISDNIIFKNFNLIDYLNVTNLHTDSFYCGDAGGEKHDWSDMDIKFATRNLIKYYRPHEIFNDNYIYQFNDFSENITENIIIMCGSPASGKTTFINNNLMDYNIISSDQFKSNKNNMKKKFKELIANGIDKIVIDACNASVLSRKFWIDLVPENFNYKIIKINVDKCIAIERNAKRYNKVPVVVIYKWFKNYEK